MVVQQRAIWAPFGSVASPLLSRLKAERVPASCFGHVLPRPTATQPYDVDLDKGKKCIQSDGLQQWLIAHEHLLRHPNLH